MRWYGVCEWGAERGMSGGGAVPVYFLFHEPTGDSWTLIDVSREPKGVSITYGRIYGSRRGPPREGSGGRWGATLGEAVNILLGELEKG